MEFLVILICIIAEFLALLYKLPFNFWDMLG